MNEVLILLFILSAFAYYSWRFAIATDARIALMEELDQFLSPESGNDELTKYIAYKLYENSKDQFFIIKVVIRVLFRSRNIKLKAGDNEFDKLPAHEREQLIELYKKFLMANMKLSPITYFAMGVVFLFISLISTLINRTSFLGASNTLQTFREKILFYS